MKIVFFIFFFESVFFRNLVPPKEKQFSTFFWFCLLNCNIVTEELLFFTKKQLFTRNNVTKTFKKLFVFLFFSCVAFRGTKNSNKNFKLSIWGKGAQVSLFGRFHKNILPLSQKQTLKRSRDG